MPARAMPEATTATQEWRRHWPLVLAGLMGLSMGILPTATLGLFMQPLSDAFGWSRTQVSFGLTIFALVSLPLTPFVGMLVDRFGPRRVAIPGLLLSGSCFAAFSLMTGSFLQWVLVWIVYTIVSLMTRTLVWSSSISAAFTKGRGLAIAVVLCGNAIATAAGPTVARLLIEQWGWRGGYIGLGLGWGGLALLLVLLFFHDVRGPAASATDKTQPRAAQLHGGLTLGQAVRNPTIQRITLAIFLQSVMGTAIMVHMVPMLGADGLSRAEATTVATLLGVASLIGNLATGWMIDRMTGSLLPVLCFGGPGVAYALLLLPAGSVWLLSAAVFILGYCMGAAIQLAIYLTTRYAGLLNFGAISGVLSSLLAGAAGIGPVVAGQVFDITGSYAVLQMAGLPIAVLAGLSVFRLGPYPVFAKPEEEDGFSAQPAPAE